MKSVKVLVLDSESKTGVVQDLLHILESAPGIEAQVESHSIDWSLQGEKLSALFRNALAELVVLVATTPLDLLAISSLIPIVQMDMSNRPILAVMEGEDPEITLELLKIGVDDFVTLPLKSVEIIPRVVRLLSANPKVHSNHHELKKRIGL
jgi:DNA-binding response OmpR family regulator